MKYFTRDLVLILCLISLIFGGVHIVRKSLLQTGQKYTPLVTVGTDIHTVDEVFYAQRIQKAASGVWLVGDRHFYEHRNDAFIYPTFTPFIFGLVTRVLGNIEYLFILADFVFPPLTFLLLYLLLFSVTRNRIISFTGAITSLMYDIFQLFLAN